MWKYRKDKKNPAGRRDLSMVGFDRFNGKPGFRRY
jgi:hypothetical protein